MERDQGFAALVFSGCAAPVDSSEKLLKELY
jgi:hypothetical protein